MRTVSAVRELAGIADGAAFDVAVLGAGAAGMAAAVFAALAGRRVLLVERTEYLGGTSAYSAATAWIPNTRHSHAIGAEDSFEKASGFLDRAVGNRSPKALRDAFLAAGPAAVDLLEERTPVRFRARPFHPDYLSDLEGATSCGRALEPLPFEAGVLGRDLALIRPPIPEFTVLGMMVDRDDVQHLLAIGKSFYSTLYSLRLIAKSTATRQIYGRSSRLVMGNALIGRLLLAARELGVDIVTRTRVRDFAVENGAVAGIVAEAGNGTVRRIAVTGGVVLASGGFARHPQRRREMLPEPVPEFSPSAPGHTGELHDLALALGAHYGRGAVENAFFAPVSVRRRDDGTTAVFPHFILDRSKPGIVTVGRDGRRFVNESTSYHLFVRAMYAANRDGATIPAFLVTDRRGLERYGLGMVRPGGRGLKPFLADGYLVSGGTLVELAGKLGIDGGGLAVTVAAMNRYAEAGVDPEFGRGTTVYERANGDPAHGPNPTLGVIGTPPFYAVRLWPGDIGSATGLVTDTDARVLRADGTPIAGLYACGNDMQSIMGGVYPGPGITIGPGITFGYIAARHAAARSPAQRERSAA